MGLAQGHTTRQVKAEQRPSILSAPPSYVLPGPSKVGWGKGQGWMIFIPSLSDLLDDHFN